MIFLRPRQELFVERAMEGLGPVGVRLYGRAPTGFGKTACISEIINRSHQQGLSRKTLVVQHRDELVEQNRATLERLTPNLSHSVFNGKVKDTGGEVVFGMVQSLARALPTPSMFDLVVIDEAHHADAPTYRSIVDAIETTSQGFRLLGVTATPMRGGRVGILSFDRAFDEVPLYEVVESNHLVKPSTMVVDVGKSLELSQLETHFTGEFNMAQAAKVLNDPIVNLHVAELWKEHAKDRQTIAFCTTRKHAAELTGAMRARDIHAELLIQDTGKDQRADIVARYRAGEFPVLVNVMVATEGFDAPETSCIMLLRPSSFKSTMLQMIGRGLRIAPGKEDCLVMDFGRSSLDHGLVESYVNDREDELGSERDPLLDYPTYKKAIEQFEMDPVIIREDWFRELAEKLEHERQLEEERKAERETRRVLEEKQHKQLLSEQFRPFFHNVRNHVWICHLFFNVFEKKTRSIYLIHHYETTYIVGAYGNAIETVDCYRKGSDEFKEALADKLKPHAYSIQRDNKPTEKQLKLLKKLGYSLDDIQTRQKASSLIEGRFNADWIYEAVTEPQAA